MVTVSSVSATVKGGGEAARCGKAKAPRSSNSPVADHSSRIRREVRTVKRAGPRTTRAAFSATGLPGRRIRSKKSDGAAACITMGSSLAGGGFFDQALLQEADDRALVGIKLVLRLGHLLIEPLLERLGQCAVQIG